MAKQTRKKPQANPQARTSRRPAAAQQPRQGSGASSSSRTGRRQQELQMEKRRSRGARARIAQIGVGILVAMIIAATILGTLSSLR